MESFDNTMLTYFQMVSGKLTRMHFHVISERRVLDMRKRDNYPFTLVLKKNPTPSPYSIHVFFYQKGNLNRLLFLAG